MSQAQHQGFGPTLRLQLAKGTQGRSFGISGNIETGNMDPTLPTEALVCKERKVGLAQFSKFLCGFTCGLYDVMIAWHNPDSASRRGSLPDHPFQRFAIA